MQEVYIEVTPMQCCGVMEISGIAEGSAEGIAIDLLATEDYHSIDSRNGYTILLPYAPEKNIIIFTQASRNKTASGYGYRLKAYIEQHNLGRVVVGAPAINPNTKNQIHTFVWTLNRKGIEPWLRPLNATLKAKGLEDAKRWK